MRDDQDRLTVEERARRAIESHEKARAAAQRRLEAIDRELSRLGGRRDVPVDAPRTAES